MQVERLFTKVTDRRVSIELPDSFNDGQVEVIVLALDEAPPVMSRAHRRPHPDIAGQVIIHGDILNTVPERDWDLPR
ncbi:hypothetical protein [uncultured Thiodictyon sp.]|uniref:hypothetical protein n=1 Tax=uncultured Thiodictyon sp. TaxID=1846217 RepID=UPI0025D3A128|nr:hypothetical protein [uncultured Thiodictyon sp.]